MTDATLLPFPVLATQGLNLQAIFDLKQLPATVTESLALDASKSACYTQLLLIGHGGRQLWQTMQARGMGTDHHIDDLSHEQMAQLFEGPLAGHRYKIIFPGSQSVGLQRLGELAGWHHETPFKVGIHPTWGTWFAYRAVVVANTALPLTHKQAGASPCVDCVSRPCISACPAAALVPSFQINACLNHRKQAVSSCEDRCLARNACPVGSDHRYTAGQTSYHYLQSMAMIRKSC